jgi:hypothetical protein
MSLTQFRAPRNWNRALLLLTATAVLSVVLALSFSRPGHSAVTVVSGTPAGSTPASGAFNLTLTAPSVVIADVLVAHIAVAEAGLTTFICPPADWFSIEKTADTQNKILHETFYLRTTAAATTPSYTWSIRETSCAGTPSTGKGASGNIIKLTGLIASGDPVAAKGETSGASSSSTATSPAVTVPAAVTHPRVIRFYAAFKNTSFSATNGASGTLLYTAGLNTTKERTIAAFDTGTSVAQVSATLASSGEWASQTVAFIPAPTLAFSSSVASGSTDTCLGPYAIQTRNEANAAINVTLAGGATVNLTTNNTGTV